MFVANLFTVKENMQIARDVYRMVLLGDTSSIRAPGQFINIKIPGFYLRRPISVCDWTDTEITIVYKVLGEGTAIMAEIAPDTQLDILTGLGNGFNAFRAKERAVLIGGGVGIPPLYGLAKKLAERDIQIDVALGCNNKDDLFLIEEFEDLGVTVHIATMDGSIGMKGLITDLLAADKLTDTYYYACGPLGMLKAVHKLCSADGQLSLEERMGCGFGACMGCSIITTKGSKRVCKEGPVFVKEELLW